VGQSANLFQVLNSATTELFAVDYGGNASTSAITTTGDLYVNGNATTTASNGNIATRGTMTVAGESGSGKSETAHELMVAMKEDDLIAEVLGQDDYFQLQAFFAGFEPVDVPLAEADLTDENKRVEVSTSSALNVLLGALGLSTSGSNFVRISMLLTLRFLQTSSILETSLPGEAVMPRTNLFSLCF